MPNKNLCIKKFFSDLNVWEWNILAAPMKQHWTERNLNDAENQAWTVQEMTALCADFMK